MIDTTPPLIRTGLENEDSISVAYANEDTDIVPPEREDGKIRDGQAVVVHDDEVIANFQRREMSRAISWADGFISGKEHNNEESR